MTDPHAYRADDDLAAALRQHAAADRAFRQRVVERDQANPGREILWSRSPFSNDQHPMGFVDSTDDVPEGLSRRQGRTALIPKRGKLGQPWREVLAEMKRRPEVEKVYQRFNLPSSGRGGETGTGGHYLAPTQFFDAGDDGVIVFCRYDLATDPLRQAREQDITVHLTPIPVSEFYRLKERLEAERTAAKQTAEATA